MDEGKVSASGRGNYEVTRSGIEWVLENAESLESYARHIRRDIIQQVSVWTAIAAEDLTQGDEVGVYMKGGFLYAGKKAAGRNRDRYCGCEKRRGCGCCRLNGIIDHKEGMIHVCKVPGIQHGSSQKDKRDQLLEVINEAGVIAAVGLEAFIALKSSREKTRHVLWCP